MYEDIHMPYHRSITRIHRNETKEITFNICCGIILLYIILSIVLSSQKINTGVIFLIIFCSFTCGTCIVYICVETCYIEDEESDNIPTITAYPISDNHEPFQDIVPVVCTPVVE